MNKFENDKQKSLTVSVREATSISIEPSVHEGSLCLSRSNYECFSRDPSYHISLTPLIKLELKAMPLEESWTGHEIKKHDAIVNAHGSKSIDIASMFLREDPSVLFDSAPRKNQAEHSGHIETKPISNQEGKAVFVNEAESPASIELAVDKISDEKDSISPEDRLIDVFFQFGWKKICNSLAVSRSATMTSDSFTGLEACAERDSTIRDMEPAVGADCVMELKQQGSAVVEAVTHELIQKGMSTNYNSTNDVSGSHTPDQASKTEIITETPIKLGTTKVHSSPGLNAAKNNSEPGILSDLLGNFDHMGKEDADLSPVEIWLQNTMSKEETQQFIEDSTLTSKSNKIEKKESSNLVTQKVAAADRYRRLSIKMGLKDFQRKLPPYCQEKPNE